MGEENPETKPVEEVAKTDPVEKTVETAAPPAEHAEHVTRGEFDSLKSAIDGLTETVARLAPKDPQQDVAPGGVPWTHKGSRHG